MRVFITGGTGLVGRAVVRALLDEEQGVCVLTRDTEKAGEALGEGPALLRGDPAQRGAWEEGVDGADAVISLAGEPIFGGRWTAAKKERLRSSRIDGTRHVIAAIERASRRPRVLVGASAVGYYGPRGDEDIDETAPPGEDFLARLCVEWEEAALAARDLGVRVAILRLGVVLSGEGGALGRMLPAFRAFLGGPVGSGEQWLSWIHIADVVGLFRLALDAQALSGAVNATAPAPVRSREFARALGGVLRRPSALRAPGWVLRLAFGEAAGVLLSGARVIPRAATEAGYLYRFPDLRAALEDLLAATE